MRRVMTTRWAISAITSASSRTWTACGANVSASWSAGVASVAWGVMSDLPGASTREGHPAPYPVELAERLIKLFSFAGDTILDPFAGTGSTSQAAIMAGRNSIANEIEPAYVDIARRRIARAAREPRLVGAVDAEVLFEGEARTNRIPAFGGIQAVI